MNKQTFIDTLKMTLIGKVPAHIVQENVLYYEQYINDEIRKGRQEDEICGMLGDPRHIAKSIMTAGNYEEDNHYDKSKEIDGDYNSKEKPPIKGFRIQGLAALIVGILVILFVIGLALSILSALLPFIIPIIIILFVVNLWKRNG